MIFFTHQDYMHRIYELLEKQPTSVWIASFNLQIGISARGGVYDKLDSHRALRWINQNTRDSRILIGLPALTDLPKLTNAAEFFDRISWRYSLASHLKCWIFHYPAGNMVSLVGSRNLGDSTWSDATVQLVNSDSIKLRRFYDSLWSVSKRPEISTLTIATPTDGNTRTKA